MSNVKEWKAEYGFGRPMSDTEILMNELHQRASYVLLRTLVVSYEEEKPSLEQINEALKALMKWNPTLRSDIQKDSSGNWEFRENDLAKPRLECLYNEENWKKVMEDLLPDPLPDLNAPQFKCVYLPNAQHTQGDTNTCTFVFVINHGIIDGMSTMATMKKFRALLDEIVKGKAPSINAWPKMHPPCEYYVDRALQKLPEEVRQELESVASMDFSQFLGKPCLFIEKMGRESKKNPNIPFTQGLTFRLFSADQTKALRLACRANNTTIQAAAQIAGSIALAKLMQKEGEKEWEPLKITYSLAANLRPHAAQEVSVDYTGFFVTPLFGFVAEVEKEVSIDSTWREAFWKLAQDSTKQIKEQVKDQSFLAGFILIKAFCAQMEMFDKYDNSESEGRNEELLYTTSYGAWDFPSEETDSIKPVAVYTNSSIHKSGPVFNQQLISVNGQLSWTVGWSKRVMSQRIADKFANLLFDIIENIMKD